MEKVLVINDSKFEREVLKNLLTDLNKKVKVAREFSAVDELQEFKPDLIIVNLIMEKTTGDKLIASIKQKYPEIKCILSSANSISLADYKEQQVDAVLQTPLDKEKLVSILDTLAPETGNYDFCPYCGGELSGSQMSFCPHCGEKL